MSRPTTADELRRAFVGFFTDRRHASVPSASVIPVDRTLLFTVAGMVPFKPYFTGEEPAPYRRAVSVQKCIRAGGKHNDLDDIGRTNRHFSFFEMLGNFSFGDYFKHEAITWAWEFVTGDLGFDPDRIWVTVHHTDDDAARIWQEAVGVPAERIQRLGDDTNMWRMADTGPCGYNSELFYDLTPELGPGGGPEADEDRYVEFWNLVFMEFDQQADGTMVRLPNPSVDTGAGLERCLALLQDAASIWDIDVFRPIIAAAERATGATYGGFPGGESDVSLRIIAEHARTMTVMVADGVRPSNQERGYVLRRIIRRAVRHAYTLGARDVVMPAMVDAVVASMGEAYPELAAAHGVVRRVIEREEAAFRATLARGVEMLDGIVTRGDISGDDAFFLHDTLGFPIDLTREVAEEQGRAVDLDAFAVRMAEQRARARAAAEEAGAARGTPLEVLREIVDEGGPTEFTGRREATANARIVALLADGERTGAAAEGAVVDVVLDRTPFYAESGGQVGDTGTLTTAAGAILDVTDTRSGLPGQLVVHEARVRIGSVVEGDEVEAGIDVVRRDRIRRNHTATHLLHWALRQVLGSHVQQAGSLVAPDRLRFDFSHHEPVTAEQILEIERLANSAVIADTPVRHYETTKAEAEALGAIAFFGEKYGEIVRVLEAGPSVELCGGTHVDALGFIGSVKVVSEGSVGSNLRRIEAMTGDGAFEHVAYEESLLRRAGELLRAAPKEVPDRIERLNEQVRSLTEELERLRSRETAGVAARLASEAVGGVLIARVDGSGPRELSQLAKSVLQSLGSGVVALVGVADATAAIAVVVGAEVQDRGANAGEIAGPAAKLLGGGTARNAQAVSGGGKFVDRVDDALALLTEQVSAWKS
ncbi:MAG: alanine--tRNA ligase [Actinomycetota bacterium]